MDAQERPFGLLFFWASKRKVTPTEGATSPEADPALQALREPLKKLLLKQNK
jgi:hypothetical protein